VAATQFDRAVHAHLSVLDEQLGLAAGPGRTGQLEKRPQREGTPDGDVDQLLRRIGMMR
jgi:hypothetical protein